MVLDRLSTRWCAASHRLQLLLYECVLKDTAAIIDWRLDHRYRRSTLRGSLSVVPPGVVIRLRIELISVSILAVQAEHGRTQFALTRDSMLRRKRAVRSSRSGRRRLNESVANLDAITG